MRIFLVILVEEYLPEPVEFFQCMDFCYPDLFDEPVDDSVELLNLALTLAFAGLCPEEADAEPRTALDQLGGNVFFSVIRVATVKFPELEDGLVEGIFHDGGGLIVIEL